jgi:hypothetical protein
MKYPYNPFLGKAMKQISYRKALLAILCIVCLVFFLGSCKSNDVAKNRAACEDDPNCANGSGSTVDNDGGDDGDGDSSDAFFGFETEHTELTQSGNAAWLRTTSNPNQGSYSYRSGVITHNQSSCFQVSRSYSTVTFKYRTDSEATYDVLKFYVDNVQKNSTAYSGMNGSWTLASFSVGSGSHIFKWCYSKDGNTSSGSDLVQVDNISFYY